MSASDTQYADHPQNPYHLRRGYLYDQQDFIRRAEAVADRHVRSASPEFIRWLSGRLDDEQIASIFGALFSTDEHRRIVRNSMAPIYDRFAEWARGNPHELRTEIAREM